MTTNILSLLAVIILIGLYIASTIKAHQQRRWDEHVNRALSLSPCRHCGRYHAEPEDCTTRSGDSDSRGRHPSA